MQRIEKKKSFDYTLSATRYPLSVKGGDKMANIKAKAPVIVLIILLIISVGLAGIAFYSLQKEQTKTVALQQDLEDLRANLKIIEKKLQDSQSSVTELESKLRDNDTLLTELKTKLETEKSESEKILNEKEKIQSDLEQQKKLRGELENRYIKLLEQSKKALQQVEELTAQKNELEKKIQGMESKAEGIELGKIVVGPESEESTKVEEALKVEGVSEENPVITEPQEEPVVKGEIKAAEEVEKKPVEMIQEEPVKAAQEESKLEGKVLVVNKEYGFAVIDMGSNEGVKLDDIFSVYQDNKQKKKYIGDLKIEKVHESMSAAGFVNNKVKDRINEGDAVILKK